MAILICNIIDGIVQPISAQTIAIHETNITAVGMVIDDVSALQNQRRRNKILTKYQKINSDYFSDYTMAPLRFGNMVASDAEVKQFLRSSYVLLQALLQKVTGKAEFVIQIKFDMNVVIKQISSQIDITDKAAVGKRLLDLSERYKTEIYASLHQRIAEIGIETEESSSSDNAVMLLNQSYLIRKHDEQYFEKVVNELAEVTDDAVVFHYLGPLPPYSFVAVEFNRGVFDLLDNARLLLGLGETCTLADVKLNYKKLAQQYHPDKNPAGNAKFQALNAAYQLVLSYCNSAIAIDGQWSFAAEAIESSFIQNS